MSEPTRRCGMGTKCHGWALGDDGKRVAALLSKPEGLCEPCQAWVQRVLDDFPQQWLKLELTLGEHRAPHSERTRRPKPGSIIPLNVTTDELQHRVDDLLLNAALLVASEMKMKLRRYEGESTIQVHRRIQRYATLVYTNLDKLLAAEPTNASVRGMVQLHSTIVRHLGETAQRERKHLPCPQCGAQGLVKEVQDNRGKEYHSDNVNETPEVVRCTNCDGAWSEEEYNWLSRIVLSEREEREMVEWLLAEARWERDYCAWLAAERLWLLARAAVVTSMDVDEFESALRHAAV